LKNRKLFAILTLVAFMMTLLPMAAFAGTPGVADTPDRHASIVKVDKTKVEAKAAKHAEFTVYVRDNDNDAIPNAIVYVASERGTTDSIVTDNATNYPSVSSGAANVVAFRADNNGKVVFNVSSTVPGDAEIAVGLNNQVYAYLIDSDTTAATAGVIAVKTITFEATDASDVKLVSAKNRAGSSASIATPTGSAGDRTYYSNATGLDMNVAANQVDYYKLKFAVVNDANAPVEGKKIEVSANKNDVSFNVTEKETDEIGEAEFKVYAKKAGTYKITAQVGSDKAVVWVTFDASDIADVELVKTVDPKVATGVDKPASFKLNFKDANGYSVSPDNIDFTGGDTTLEFEWITEPKDSDLPDDWAWDGISFVSGYYSFTEDDYLQIKLPEIEEEGNYVLRVNIENGKYVDIEFEAKEQGDITKLTVAYDNANIELGGVSDAPTVKRVDAEGIAVEVTSMSELEFSLNDYRALEKDAIDHDNNPSTPDINPRDEFTNNGVLYVTDDDDYVGTYVVTVVDTKENLTASTEFTIGDAAIGLDVEVPATIPVGVETPVKVSIVDANDRVVGLGTNSAVQFDAYIVAQPAGANASVEATNGDDKLAKDLKEKGYANVDFYSKVAGEVKATLVLKVTKADGTTVNLAKTVTVNFAEPKADVVYGAKNVTMFIGSTGFVADGNAGTMDQAPFIQDNRTFVPLRAVATALGATNEDTMWDPATQTITLVRPDLTVTMTIGSNVLTLSDGSTVVADVAPFIVAETGRTVIPFRAIAEAFGADVEAVFGADGTTTAVTFTQE